MQVRKSAIPSAGDDLDEAVSTLYSEFRAYPMPSMMSASSVRDIDQIMASLQVAPLSSLSGDDLGAYAFSAMTTVGSPDDFKHFLPRILQLACIDFVHPGFEPEIIASRMLLAGWGEWAVSEQSAVAEFCRAIWAFSRLQHTDRQIRSWAWIHAMVMLDLNFQACLDSWTKAPTGNAILQFSCGQSEIKALLRRNGIWREAPQEKRRIVLEWIAGHEVEAMLVGSIDLVAPDDRWQIEMMLDEIEELRSELHKS